MPLKPLCTDRKLSTRGQSAPQIATACRRCIALLLCCLLNINAANATDTTSAPPNIVLILADDMGWGDIGFNNPNVYSPHLDELASTGVVFQQHYVMPQCTPTRVALMTGRYPSRFGGAALQASNNPAFPLETPTIASLLRSAGYRTYLAGKWHLGSDPDHGPNHFGFDSSYGSFAGAVGMYDHRYRTGDFEHTWHRDHELIPGAENGTHATDLVAAEAIRVIELNDANPFFLYLPFHAVHTPLDERGRFIDRPTQLDPDDPTRWLDEDEIPWFNDPQGKIQRETDPEKRLLLAAVHHLDHAIGQIVETLEATGKRDNTLILFSSDNGPQGSWNGNAYPDDLKLTDFNQPIPFRGKKVDVWEGGIRVPGFANWPARLDAGSFDSPTHIVDWLPTLASIAGAEANTNGLKLDGASFWNDGLQEAETLQTRDLYWNWKPRINRWALRHGDWKIVKYGQGAPKSAEEWELYNLQSDPAESVDLAEKNATQREALHRRFLHHRKRDHVTK
ncbi:arylsulfatase [Rhodopirellula sp. JC740]|uniref:Arylsulfatase n=1 Tax=Rhodopirellula halodulae TaxID=2894198 RepID=A0ABS8NL86_9BACT|nr:arylsulfatase [Rhodopirellula sp. JC740]MCC9643573.1 arylsulfatase [Rhodopirellula sp. JC740]